MPVAVRGHNVVASALLKRCRTFFGWCCEAVDLENKPALSISGGKVLGPRYSSGVVNVTSLKQSKHLPSSFFQIFRVA